MPTLNFGFNQGLVTARGRETLGPGELQTATGLYYKPGDPLRAHKILGRSAFDDVPGAPALIKGLALCQFDSGSDKLVAFAGVAYYNATPGVTGTFTTLQGGLNSSATKLSAAHFDDKWFLANGYDRVRVLQSSGSIRNASMFPPTTLPTFTTAATAAAIARPSTYNTNSGWINPNLAHDGGDGGASTTPPALLTFSHATASAAAAAQACTWTGWSSSTTSSRQVMVTCKLGGGAAQPGGLFAGIAGTFAGGYSVTLKLEVLGDTGGTRTIYNETRTTPHSEPYLLVVSPISANSNAISVRGTFTYNTGTVQATFRIHDIRIKSGGDQSNFTPTEPFYYSVTEFDQTTGLESAPGPFLEINSTNFVTKNSVTLTFPAAVNSTTTHFYLYRTFEGGTPPQDLGRLDIIPILDSGGAQITGVTYTDSFEQGKTVDDSLFPIVPLLRVPDRNTGEGELFFPRDVPIPTLSYITAWKGSLCGLSREFPRALRYSAAGFPESWPIIYVIEKFPLPEHDELVAIVPCAETLLILAEGAVLTLTDLPQVLDGVFNAGEASPLRAAPGCVGQYAATAFSVAGEPRVAWVSTFGVYASNGQTVWRLSDDLDWSSAVYGANLASAVLHWDSERQVIIFAYDSDASGTTNNRFYLIHMAPEHQKEGGNPKITGPHYGSINCMASGVVSMVYRLYSGHVSDGFVYLEGGAATDASQSYSSTQVPLIALTGRNYNGWRDFSAYRGNLRHTNFGSGQTCSMVWSWGRDSGSVPTGTTTKTVSLYNQVGTDFFIGRSSEWAEMQLTHTGSGTGALLDCRVDVQIMEKSGRKVG